MPRSAEKQHRDYKGEQEDCSTCGLRVRLTPRGLLPVHGPKGNRCPLSGHVSATRIRAERGGTEPEPERPIVQSTSTETRVIYTLVKPYRVTLAGGEPLWAAAFVVTVQRTGYRFARAVGERGNDREPREYIMSKDCEREILRHLGLVM